MRKGKYRENWGCHYSKKSQIWSTVAGLFKADVHTVSGSVGVI